MLVKVVRVTDKGQISIPVDILRKAGIERGSDLLVFEDKGRILIEKPETITLWSQQELKDIQKIRGKTLKEIWDNSKDEAWSRKLESTPR
ncbi:MAG: AbrB/MazE/SpoVT family DNA-binding domain-containing protein [Candidatus Woesearchaeota archaeon]